MARLFVSWSGGKDSCLALARTMEAGHQIAGLLVTVSHPLGRVTMHGVRRELIAAQAQRLGLPLQEVLLPLPQPGCPADRCPLSREGSPQAGLVPDTTYEKAMLAALQPLKASGVEGVVFGDISLGDLRRFREQLLARIGLRGYFPLWGQDPELLLEEFHQRQGQALVVCCRKDLQAILGKATTNGFRRELPAGVDPCGEKGEFHTFAQNLALFSHPVLVRSGITVERDGFLFQDLVLA